MPERPFASDALLRSDLREPFAPEQIGKLPATSKRPALDYVGHAAVTDRLNQAAPDWSYELTPVVIRGTITGEGRERHFVPEETGLPHVVAVFGSMTVGGVTRQEVGDVESFTAYGDELKKAISDFIRRGAMRFGVALDLWSKEDLSNEDKASAEPTGEGGTAEDPAHAGTTEEAEGEGEQGSGPLPSPEAAEDSEPASDAQWAIATTHGITAAKAMVRAKKLGISVSSASGLTKGQLARIVEDAL